MNPAINKITKFLQLEAERGFDDRAVVGGLGNMLEPWRTEAHSAGLGDDLISAVESRLRDYDRLSPGSRSDVLKGLWKRLQSAEPGLDAWTFDDVSAEKVVGETTDEVEYSPVEQSVDPPSVAAEQTTPQDANESTSTPSVDLASPEVDSTHKPVASSDVSTAHAVDEKLEATPPAPAEPPAALKAPLTTVPGIGPKSAKTLEKLEMRTLADLLWHLPRRYDDYSQLETINRLWYGREVTVIGTVEKVELREVRRGRMKLTEALISDGTGALRITWFNQPWIANRLKPGQPIVLSGKVDQYLGKLTMSNPEWEPLEQRQLHTNRIVPVYPLTAGISGKWLRRVIHSVVQRLALRVPDPLPDRLRESAELMPLGQAIMQVHFPDNWEILKKAQHRLAFDEMFMLQLGVLRQKRAWEAIEGQSLGTEDEWVKTFIGALPYDLTKAQKRAIEDIRADLASTIPMNRLLQGDVGSGKTVVAAAAIGMTTSNQAQSAFMAPTSILAEQHYRTLLEFLPSAADIPAEAIKLLLGATTDTDKEAIRMGLEAGDVKVVVGTHALIEDPIAFKQLGLVIIDEQHRFGVEQRAILRQKGDNPNLLVMTATPIPRSLALTVYGDLDLSVLDEMPPGRQPIETRVLLPKERSRAYSFIQGQVEHGQQAFVIYPLVEGSEKVQAKAAVDEQAILQEQIFPEYSVGLLHGRMKADEKDQTMQSFRKSELDILVSTSVVEVGVDIPNATVMLIEGANHFGLAQLHQFRGRVGRGTAKSFCLLIPDQDSDADNQRLKAMQSTNDGFELAEMDLDQRGPGDFLGTRQSGFAELKTAQLTDVKLIEKARREAHQLFEVDPELNQPDHALLAEELTRFWTIEKGEMS
jgi:ATP-dependent DNA helicase RecG